MPPQSKLIHPDAANGRGHTTLLGRALVDEIRVQVLRRFGSINMFSQHVNLSESYIYNVLSGRQRASVAALEALAAHAGVELVISSRPIRVERVGRRS